ncbi:MAG: hypothetical protein JWO40_232 [Candidatus Doudnabacteria bacterium]|nr:hypothetical protein [Candidatus Doudnabacteria bacterium]
MNRELGGYNPEEVPEPEPTKESKDLATLDRFVLMIQKNDLGAYSYMKSHKMEINTQNSDGVTPLIAAIQNKNFSMFSFLVNEKKIDFHATDKDGHTPLWHAMKSEDGSYKMTLKVFGAKS